MNKITYIGLIVLFISVLFATITSDHNTAMASLVPSTAKINKEIEIIPITPAKVTPVKYMEPKVIVTEIDTTVETPVMMVWRDEKTGKYLSRTLVLSYIWYFCSI